jgi:predicted PurR-regulated permease PerM
MSFPPPTSKQAKVIWFAATGVAITVLVILAAALVWGLGQALHLLSPVVWPLAVAGVIAYLLDPVVDYLEARGLPRTRAILCVFSLAVVLMVGLLSSVVPQLVTETRDLAQRIPTYAKKLRERVETWVNQPPALLRKFMGRPAAAPGTNVTNSTALTDTNTPPSTLSTNATPGVGVGAEPRPVWDLDKEALQTATGWLAKVVPRLGSWLFGQVTRVASWMGVLAGLALVPVYAFYFLLEKRGIESKWTDYLPVTKSEFKDELVFVLKSINAYLIVFFRSQVLVAICDGVLYTLGFILIGLPYSVLLGVLAIGLTMIPFLGAMATCALALILAFVQYGDWQHPALVLVVFAVVQTLEGLVISPKIMGDRVGLHPLSIIVAVMVGTTLLGGILGGVLAIPLTAAARVLMFRYIWKKREA